MTGGADGHFMGLPAYSRDGGRLGKIKNVVHSGEKATYFVIGGFLSRGLVVPSDIIEERGDAVVVPFMSSYLDMAPPIDPRKPLTVEDRDRLRDYYHTAGS